MSELLIGWTTCDATDVAERFAQTIIERDLAACVQIEDGVRSVFKWKGEVQNDLECRLCIKFPEEKYDALCQFIKVNHPYDNPEWVVIRPDSVAEKYLKWATAGS